MKEQADRREKIPSSETKNTRRIQMLLPIGDEFEKAGLLTVQQQPDQDTEPHAWHLLLTEVGQDKMAEWWLRHYGYRVFWPNYTKQVRHAHGHRFGRQTSVLPGYLPIALPIGFADWDGLRSTPRVRDVFRQNGNIAVIGERDIMTIRIIADALNAPPPPERERWMPRLGQAVTIMVDLWSEMTAIVIDLASEARIGLEVEWLGRRMKVFVATSQIAPI